MYTLVGDGRVAKHFAYYFTHLNIPFNQWSRKQGGDFVKHIQASSHVLLMITDAALENFLQQYPVLTNKIVVHFSGALTIEKTFAAHPLVSFSNNLFDLEFYKKIAFIIDAEGAEFTEILPGLPNPYFRIPRNDKALYHAYCVLSGNFTTLLWQKFFSKLEAEWDIPAEAGYQYMQSIMQNLQQNREAALTGPLARGDQITMQKNLTALNNDPLAKIYRAFVESYHG